MVENIVDSNDFALSIYKNKSYAESIANAMNYDYNKTGIKLRAHVEERNFFEN